MNMASQRLGLALVLLVLLAGAFSAQIFYPKGWNSSSKKLNPRDVYIPPYEYGPNDNAYSDIAFGRAGDQFNYSRLHIAPGDPRLTLFLASTCSDQDIMAQVRFSGAPVGGATLGLYGHAGGRHLIAETMTDPNGWTLFARRPPGRYDITVEKDGYVVQQRVLDWQPCPTTLPQKTREDAGGGVFATPDPDFFNQTYASGATRRFGSILLPDGRRATQVILSMPARQGGETSLYEAIPPALASRTGALGFQENYPAALSNSTPIWIRWDVPPLSAGQRMERRYVIMRTVDGTMMSAYSVPPVLGNASLDARAWSAALYAGGASGANMTRREGSNPASGSPPLAATAAGGSSSLSLDWVWGATGGLVAMGLLGAVLFYFAKKAKNKPVA